jgi:hypothetical protein
MELPGDGLGKGADFTSEGSRRRVISSLLINPAEHGAVPGYWHREGALT